MFSIQMFSESTQLDDLWTHCFRPLLFETPDMSYALSLFSVTVKSKGQIYVRRIIIDQHLGLDHVQGHRMLSEPHAD